MNQWIKIKPSDVSPSKPFITIDKERIIFCNTQAEHFQNMDFYSLIPDPKTGCGWNIVTVNSEKPPSPFLIVDAQGFISVGETAFDFYDSLGWIPIPFLPTEGEVTSDEWISLLKNILSN